MNFRGVSDATIDLTPRGAGVFTLIGLNESGKTTILEAISTIQIRGGDEKSLYQSKPAQIDPASFVPKHEQATFSGDIYVAATIEFEAGEKAECISSTEKATNCKIDPASIPDRITIKRGYKFSNGDCGERINHWSFSVMAKEKGKRNFGKQFRPDQPIWTSFSGAAAARIPEIVYFPTFLFEQPDRIVLNPQKDEKQSDRLYRTIIENVGKSLPKPIDTKVNIVDRIIAPETLGEAFAGFFSLSNTKQQQIESAINQLSQHLSSTVLDNWTRIFGGSKSNREIRLKLGVDKHPDDTPRVYVQFSIRDGVQQYGISERSLGFRWFFSFLLFTLYRESDPSKSRTLFLLDEPASNLHAGAQTQLLESFPKITRDGNVLVYSTHSHYLINPEWLDQAYIISNDAVEYDDIGSDITTPNNSNILATKYRNFVGRNPDKVTYFQPVLDRLQIVPSRLDALRPSALVEGKGDYLILNYGRFICNLSGDNYSIIPTRGADHFSELVGILLGWGVNFVLCFDADKKGQMRCKEFHEEWSFSNARAFTLASFDESLSGKTIEGFLEPKDLELIQKHYQTEEKLTKIQIQLFFSEHLATKKVVSFSSTFKERIRLLDKAVKSGLGL